METETIKNKIERLRIKAELLLEENKKCFIRDVYDTYHFCDIILVGEKYITFVPFKGKGQGTKITEYWVDISDIKEYHEEVGA